jgi:uroporphyrinogen decarboxylase
MVNPIIPSDPAAVREMLEKRYGHPERDQMSPHERVETALSLHQPDRVPFDFWAVPETIEKLKAYLGIDEKEDLLRLLGVDCRVLNYDYVGPEPEILADGTYYTEWGSHRRLVSNSFSLYEEYASYPLAEARTRTEVECWPRWPRPEYFDFSQLPRKISIINKNGVRYHIRVDVGGIFESSWGLYGLDHFLEELILNPEVPCAIMDCYTDLLIALVHKMAAAGQGLIDWVYTYDDVAMQNGLLMSPYLWRTYILPRHQRLNDAIRSYSFRILYHSCGAIYPLIPYLIEEMGITALNPLQPKARWMDMAKIKAEFGDRIAFHGGIDLQYTLPYGSLEEVTAEVMDRCRTLGKNGGYICTSAHYIQADVPVENIIAMYSAPRIIE